MVAAESEMEACSAAAAAAAPRTPRAAPRVAFEPLDEKCKLMQDFERAKASSPECKLPRSVTPHAAEGALLGGESESESEEEEDDEQEQESEDESGEARGTECEAQEHEGEGAARGGMPQYRTLMGRKECAARSAGEHYYELLIERPSALLLVGVARPQLRDMFNSETGAAAHPDAPDAAAPAASVAPEPPALGPADPAPGKGTPVKGTRVCTPPPAAVLGSTGVTAAAAAAAHKSPLKAFRTRHAFQLHTATGDRWHYGRPCAPSPPLEAGAAAAAAVADAADTLLPPPERETLQQAGLAGLLAEPEPRFEPGDRVGVLVQIAEPSSAAAGTTAAGTAPAATAETTSTSAPSAQLEAARRAAGGGSRARARVSFTRNGRRLRAVGAFEDIAVEDGFVPVVDVALGGRVRFVDWKQYV